MIRALQSPRRRRRLIRVGSVLAVLAVVAVVAVRYTNTGDDIAPPTPGPVQHAIFVPRQVHRSPQSINQIRSVADHFIETAVYRRHLDEAWDLTAPSLRTGVSHDHWMTGDIPVVPYPQKDVDIVKWTLDYSFPRKVGLHVAFVTKPGAASSGLVARMELQQVGAGDGRRWLVDAWVPMGGGTELKRAITPFPQDNGAGMQSRLNPLFILVPIGLLVGLVVILPLGLGIRGYVRHNRAMRAYSSSSRPS